MLAAVVDDVLIHLVHDGVNVVADAEVGDGLELFLGEDLAARIGGVADQNCLRMLTERIFENLGVKVERRGNERNEDRRAVCHDRLRAVVFKIRGEHDDLVARIGQGKDCIDHGFCRADGYDHIGIRVECASHEAPSFAGQCLTEVRCAHRDGVLVRA